MECVYEPDIDGSRMKHLRRQNRVLQGEIATLRERLGESSIIPDNTLPKEELVQNEDTTNFLYIKSEDEAGTGLPASLTSLHPSSKRCVDEEPLNQGKESSERLVRRLQSTWDSSSVKLTWV